MQKQEIIENKIIGLNIHTKKWRRFKMNVIKFTKRKRYIISKTGEYTNGHWLIKKEYAPENLQKRFKTHTQGRQFSCPDTTKVWENALGDKILLDVVRNRPCKPVLGLGIDESFYFFRTAKQSVSVILDKDYVDYLIKNITGFNMKVKISVTQKHEKYTPVILYSEKTIIGLLMVVADKNK